MPLVHSRRHLMGTKRTLAGQVAIRVRGPEGQPIRPGPEQDGEEFIAWVLGYGYGAGRTPQALWAARAGGEELEARGNSEAAA